uniref:Uncharacterized protein LOC104241055 n=1 Tax=Nicotiana sylvestris TaxID=4096 RepID=A0A1U7XXB8_NICSY|nr:PREDICTED: uncharacterized protein LOC104241055 [Nicotiana sylvestris]
MMSEIIKIEYDEQNVNKKFAFDDFTIASLKAKNGSNFVQVPNFVEVISAVIWKCAMAASGNGRRSFQLVHSVNIGKRLVPSLPNHCVGIVGNSCKGTERPRLQVFILDPQTCSRLGCCSYPFSRHSCKR